MTAQSGFPSRWLDNVPASRLRSKLMTMPVTQILAVSLSSSPAEIEVAYAARARQLTEHREANSPDVADIQRILTQARDLLLDPAWRQAHERRIAESGAEPSFAQSVEKFKRTDQAPPLSKSSGNPFSSSRSSTSRGSNPFSSSSQRRARPDSEPSPARASRSGTYAPPQRASQSGTFATSTTRSGGNPFSSSRSSTSRGPNPFSSSTQRARTEGASQSGTYAPPQRASQSGTYAPPQRASQSGTYASPQPARRSSTPKPTAKRASGAHPKRVPMPQEATPSPLRSSSNLSALSGSSVNPFLSGSHVAPTFNNDTPQRPPRSPDAGTPKGTPRPRPSTRSPQPIAARSSGLTSRSSIVEKALEQARSDSPTPSTASTSSRASGANAKPSSDKQSSASGSNTKRKKKSKNQKRLEMFKKAAAREEGEPFEGALAFGVGETKRGLAHAGAMFVVAFLALLAVGATGMGQDEFKVTPDEPMIFVRSAILVVLGAGGLLGLRREQVKRIGLSPEVWPTLACIPIAFLIGALATPIARLDLAPDADLGVVLGLLAVRAVGEAIFFHGFITRTLLIELEDSALALFISALMYGAYALTFAPIAEGAILNILFGVMVYGFGSGFPLAIMYWKTRSVLVPILAQLIIFGTLAVVGLQSTQYGAG